jgi:hypothetical protein
MRIECFEAVMIDLSLTSIPFYIQSDALWISLPVRAELSTIVMVPRSDSVRTRMLSFPMWCSTVVQQCTGSDVDQFLGVGTRPMGKADTIGLVVQLGESTLSPPLQSDGPYIPCS